MMELKEIIDRLNKLEKFARNLAEAYHQHRPNLAAYYHGKCVAYKEIKEWLKVVLEREGENATA